MQASVCRACNKPLQLTTFQEQIEKQFGSVAKFAEENDVEIDDLSWCCDHNAHRGDDELSLTSPVYLCATGVACEYVVCPACNSKPQKAEEAAAANAESEADEHQHGDERCCWNGHPLELTATLDPPFVAKPDQMVQCSVCKKDTQVLSGVWHCFECDAAKDDSAFTLCSSCAGPSNE